MFSWAFLLIRDDADKEFVKDLFKKYEQIMYRKAYGILQNATDAEDAVQNAMVKVIDYLEKIRKIDDSKIQYYLTVITKHTAYDMLRRKIRKPDRYFIEELDETEADYSVEDAVLLKMDLETLGIMMKRLPEQEYDILFMNFSMGFSPTEIAEQLDISSNTARQRIHRAKQKLKMEYDNEGVTNDV